MKDRYFSFVAFSSADGKLACPGGTPRHVRLHDLDDVHDVELEHSGFVHSLAFSSDGKLLAVTTNDGCITVWHMRNLQEPAQTLRWDESESIRCVAFSPTNDFLVTGNEDGGVSLWDLKTETRERVFVGHSGLVWSVAV